MICIDFANPIVIGVSIAVISATILGIAHYGRTLAQLNFTDKKLSNVLSELDALHKNYKDEISDIKKRHGKEMEEALDRAMAVYDRRMEKLIQNNLLLEFPAKSVGYYSR